MKDKHTAGHVAAFITIIIWGTTFISTKVLLRDFAPIEILFYRFALGFIALFIVSPHRLKLTVRAQEVYFAMAGLCGITLYFLLENIALTHTLASNVGVFISIAPFFTAILAHMFLGGEKLRPEFFIGIVFAFIGIFLISFNGKMVLKLNPIGDILSILAAFVWSAYSVLTRKISEFHYNIIQTTRRIFFYGLLFIIPALFIFDFKIGLNRVLNATNFLNIIFLGLGASAICFVTWNFAVKILGAVRTSVYIYMIPVVTMIISAIILHEKITWMALLGMLFTLTGLFISERKVESKITLVRDMEGSRNIE